MSLRIREHIHHVGWERTGIAEIQGARVVERLGGFIEAAQIVENNGPVQVGFSSRLRSRHPCRLAWVP